MHAHPWTTLRRIMDGWNRRHTPQGRHHNGMMWWTIYANQHAHMEHLTEPSR